MKKQMIVVTFMMAAAAVAASRSFNVPTTAMEPTILRGEHIIVDESFYRSVQPARETSLPTAALYHPKR